MNGRERVHAAMSHMQTNLVLIVPGLSNATDMQMGTYRKYREHLELDLPDNVL